MFFIDTLGKYAVHDRLVMDAVVILTLVDNMEIIDEFVITLFINDNFLKHAVAHDRLVIDDVRVLTLAEKIELIDAHVIHAFDNDTL